MKIAPILLFIILLCGSGCQNQIVSLEKTNSSFENQKSALDESVKYIDLLDFRVSEDALIYKGYTLEKRFKSHPDLTDKAKTVEYAVLRQSDRKIEKFDLIEHPLSVIDFGLFSFLGSEEKQIFISQTAPRSGSHWIVSFKPEYQSIFNSSEFNVGGEDFQIGDFDKDGVYELSFANYISLKSNSQTPATSMPFTEIIFKFNPILNKYLPANPQFAHYLLRDVDEQTKLIRRENKDTQFADVLDITLKYIYAGKEKDAWEFFEERYDFEDKQIRINAVKSAFEKDVIYKSLKKTYDQNKLRQ